MHIVHLIDKQRTKMTRMYNTIDKIDYCKHKIDYSIMYTNEQKCTGHKSDRNVHQT